MQSHHGDKHVWNVFLRVISKWHHLLLLDKKRLQIKSTWRLISLQNTLSSKTTLPVSHHHCVPQYANSIFIFSAMMKGNTPWVLNTLNSRTRYLLHLNLIATRNSLFKTIPTTLNTQPNSKLQTWCNQTPNSQEIQKTNSNSQLQNIFNQAQTQPDSTLITPTCRNHSQKKLNVHWRDAGSIN